MKTRKLLMGTALVAFVAVLGFFACSPQSAERYIYSTEAEMFSLSVGSLDIEPEDFPTPIDQDQWESFTYFGSSEYDLDGADYGTLEFNLDEDITRIRMRVSFSELATAEWGIGTRNSFPEDYLDWRVNGTIITEEYLYIKITAEDGITTNYYRFYTRVRSPVTELFAATVAGYSATLGKPATGYQNATEGSVSITTVSSSGALVEVTPFDITSSFRYALVKAVEPPAEPEAPVFGIGAVFDIDDQDFLYVEVTAENTVAKNIYKFKVDVGRIATLQEVRFGEYIAGGKGIPNATWTEVAPGSFPTADQPAKITGGFTITIVPVDPDVKKIEWVHLSDLSVATPPVFAVYDDDNKPEQYFEHNEGLAIKVSPDNVKGDPWYYQIKVGLLAANFLEQPESAFYFADIVQYDDTRPNGKIVSVKVSDGQTIEPLKFELDRPNDEASGWRYQWYEANSWYGGYGFDADSILWGEPGFAPDFDDSDKDREGYFSDFLDEKENVSLWNGGNWYRFPYPGRPIPGATQKTYTPVPNKRPFITGLTYASHYYWVVITDPVGLVATSSRATIINETDKDKDHFIVDMNNLVDKSGRKVSSRNPIQFTKYREPYLIDLRGILPEGFDILDYSFCTAQALFYLVDGSPWIQNWTQGNISFIDVDDEDKPGQDGDKIKIVLYYNLTNNGAILGLAADGKEPAGEGVSVPFTHVVIMPSGENFSMPVYDKEKGKYDNLSAQGFFCGFIDLVEFRFEGPSRK
jgi:hypothetical protein